MKRLLLLNGPNLNLLGIRETELYGGSTLLDVSRHLIRESCRRGVLLQVLQSNSESKLISLIQTAMLSGPDAAIINSASYTHTSIGIRDALLGLAVPFIEVHLTNLKQREFFRHSSFLTDVSIGMISGFGWRSYLFAVQFAVEVLL